MMRNMKIGLRLTLLVSMVMGVVFATIVLVSIVRVNALAMRNARTIATETATAVSGSILSQLNVPLDNARALANVFESAAAFPDLKLPRAKADMLLKYFIEKNTQFPDVWAVFEPDAYDGKDADFKGTAGTDETGRYIPTWSRGQDGSGVLESNKDYEVKGPGDYYQTPKARKRESVIDPYPYTLDGRPVMLVSLAVPVMDAGGAFLGVIGVDRDLSDIQAQVKSLRIGTFTRAFMDVVSVNGTVAASTNTQFNGKAVGETGADKAYIESSLKGETFEMQWQSSTVKEPVIAVGIPVEIGQTGQKWMVNVNIPVSELTAESRQLISLLIIIAVAAVLLMILLIRAIARSIAKPLQSGLELAEQIAAGNLVATIRTGTRRDETGKLADALNAMSHKLRTVVATVQENSQQVASSSEQITASAQKLAEGAQSQASTLEETSASVEELAASVDQVSEHAQSQAAAVEQGTVSMDQVQKSIQDVTKSLAGISDLAGRSVANAEEGARAVLEVVGGINLIAESSERIGGIVTVISDIADQTNLLALNASIEAARAGEHGRGFAVVADEVSKLADRSASSTKEIESLIRESVKNVTRGVQTAKGSQVAMEQIREASQQVKDMIGGLATSMAQQVEAIRQLATALDKVKDMSLSISAATEEQTTNAKQVSRAVENVNELTQGAASAAEQMSASTAQLSTMAQELQRIVSAFRIDGDGTANGLSAAPEGVSDGRELVGVA
jgi:methyl-accepting chemotaxis protein